MKKQNTLITQESTEVVLKKATNIINRTNKILKNSKRELVTHPEIVVIDGLMYQNQPFTETYTLEEAKEYASNLRLGGYDDWRLPTNYELIKLGNIKLFSMDTKGNVFEEWKKWLKENDTNIIQNSQGYKYFIKNEFIENMPNHHLSHFWTISVSEENLIWNISFSEGRGYLDYLEKERFYYSLCARG